MRAPPPLRWPCADVRAWRAFFALCFALAGAAVVAWGLAHAEAGKSWGLLVPLCAAALALILGQRFVPMGRGTLDWTGAAWTWKPEGSDTTVELHEVRLSIDLHSILLLRLRADMPGLAGSRTAWVVVQHGQDPVQWPLLCALLVDGAQGSRLPPQRRS